MLFGFVVWWLVSLSQLHLTGMDSNFLFFAPKILRTYEVGHLGSVLFFEDIHPFAIDRERKAKIASRTRCTIICRHLRRESYFRLFLLWRDTTYEDFGFGKTLKFRGHVFEINTTGNDNQHPGGISSISGLYPNNGTAIIRESNLRIFEGDVSSGLNFSEPFVSFDVPIRGLNGSLTDLQSSPDKKYADNSSAYAEQARPEHRFGPKRHASLGAQIVFGCLGFVTRFYYLLYTFRESRRLPILAGAAYALLSTILIVCGSLICVSAISGI